MTSRLQAKSATMSRTHNPAQAAAASRPASTEEGSTVVEFAVSSTILLMLLIGLCQMSLALYSYHSVSEAARDATRWAMVRGGQCTGLTHCGATNSDIQGYLQSSALPGITAANLSTVTTWYYASMNPTTNTAVISTCGQTAASCNAPGNLVQVQVIYTYNLKIPFLAARSLTMTSTSTMPISE